MAIGYYNVTYNEDRSDLTFEVAPLPQPGDIPEDQLNLSLNIASALSIMALLYPKDSALFKKAFEQLFYLAKTGLEGPNAQPVLAAKALLQFKQEMVDRESLKVKSQYLRKLGKYSIYLGTPALLLGTIFNFINCCSTYNGCFNFPATANMLVLWAGTMLGVWLSFSITKTYLSFEDLGILEKDGLEPILRLMFTGSLAVVFGLFFIKGALLFKLGELSSDQIATDPVIAFLSGAILGINEKIIGGVLSKKTATLIQ